MGWQTRIQKIGDLFRDRLVDPVAMARQVIFSGLADGLIILDARDRILDMNPSARIILNQPGEETLGRSIAQVFKAANFLEDWSASHGQCAELVTRAGANWQAYQLRVHPLSDARNRTIGRLITLHDVTEQKLLNEQLEEHAKELQELAVTDELTGLANRRRLFELGEREVIRARRFGHHFSVILFDIDHFKRINDNYGSAVGDQVLCTLAPLAQKNIRDTDLLARYGGEEFVIALPETELSAACQVAERIRKTIAEMPIQTEKETIRITITLGVAEITAETREFVDLLNAADNAMCKAKQAGRNRIFFADHSLARHFYFDFLPT